MHPSALNFGKLFFETYCGGLQGAIVHDIGAQNVNGSLQDVCPPHLGYVGVDFVEGRGVDIVLDDPYRLPFDDCSLDIIVSSSCFEHSQFFWLIFLEMLRVLKPGGLLYINVPSNGSFHRYPVDCWRFYPDAGKALEAWAAREGYQTKLLESFVGDRSPDSFESGGAWNDFVAVFVKDSALESQFQARMQDRLESCWNGWSSQSGSSQSPGFLSPDHEKLAENESSRESLSNEITEQQHSLSELRAELAARDDQIAFMQSKLEQSAKSLTELHAAQAQIEHFLHSHSWRMTAPFRGLASMAGQARSRASALGRTLTEVGSGKKMVPEPSPEEQRIAKLDADVDTIRRSGLFDESFYRGAYPDVGPSADTIRHYCETGWLLGRDPSPDFSTQYYLDAYNDIKESGLNPFLHYVIAGAVEGRLVGVPQARRKRPLQLVDEEVHAIRQSGQFDESYYFAMNPDLQPPPADPLRHYCESGWMEGRNPSDDFDTSLYLRDHRDIREAGINPFRHFIEYGAAELRHVEQDAVTGYEDDVWFGRIEVDVTLLAFYTESPNWAAARAQGSNIKSSPQPLRTHQELGFYNGGDPFVVERQARLARNHGLLGFCFRLVPNEQGILSSQALEVCLNHPDINIQFCAQLDLRTAFPAPAQLESLARAMADVRYFCAEGLPVILVNTAASMQSNGVVVSRLTAEINLQTGSMPFVIGCWGDAAIGADLPADLVEACNALVDLPNMPVLGETGAYALLNEGGSEVAPFSVVAARGVERASVDRSSPIPVYHCVVSGRDDANKRAANKFAYKKFHVNHYRRWLDAALLAVRRLHPVGRRLLFIDGWNDWNKGQLMEPDTQAGYSRLNETSRALLGIASRAATPKVSVIVPNYNHARFLRRRLASVYGQSYKNIEVILLDDCSSDDSRLIPRSRLATAQPCHADAFANLEPGSLNE